VMTCYCCERLGAASCEGESGACSNCMRCPTHCRCPFDLRELVYDDEQPGRASGRLPRSP
jgi:hypothetical protein